VFKLEKCGEEVVTPSVTQLKTLIFIDSTRPEDISLGKLIGINKVVFNSSFKGCPVID
jgi:hypothetical protein